MTPDDLRAANECQHRWRMVQRLIDPRMNPRLQMDLNQLAYAQLTKTPQPPVGKRFGQHELMLQRLKEQIARGPVGTFGDGLLP